MQTPVLLLTFNRPQHTEKVMGAILAAQPQELYVFQDGAREGNADDLKKCAEVRQVVEKLTSETKVSLHTYYSLENLGCGPGPARGITWFFENVEKGIIMEDDCLPDPTMFFFYEYLLEKYAKDDSVFMITATNVFRKWKSHRSSYFFSKNGASPMGCWAGWSKYWTKFDYSLSSWMVSDNKKRIKDYFDKEEYFEYYSDLYDNISSSEQNHMWDYQWAYARYLSGSKTIVASKNLVSNIGFTIGATHSSDSSHKYANLPLYSMYRIKEPKTERVDKGFDYLYFFRNNYRHKKTYLQKAKLKMLELLFCR